MDLNGNVLTEDLNWKIDPKTVYFMLVFGLIDGCSDFSSHSPNSNAEHKSYTVYKITLTSKSTLFTTFLSYRV